MSDAVLPWQQTLWASLQARRRAGTLPHALLLCGHRGLGKQRFATQFARSLLCAAPHADGQACGECRSCALFRSGAHPDYRRVAPEEDSKVIKIDQIRDLCAALGFTSQYGGYQIAHIDPADALNTAAANSLLKTLEEPTPNTLLLLVTDRPASLPATLRSRCQRLVFQIPANATARAWLQSQVGSTPSVDALLTLAQGAPLRALALAQGDGLARRQTLFATLAQVVIGTADPLTVAALWMKTDAKETLDWLREGVVTMIRLKMAGAAASGDHAQTLHDLAHGLDLHSLYGHLDGVTQALRLADTSVNTQLLFEDILIPWTHHRKPAKRHG